MLILIQLYRSSSLRIPVLFFLLESSIMLKNIIIQAYLAQLSILQWIRGVLKVKGSLQVWVNIIFVINYKIIAVGKCLFLKRLSEQLSSITLLITALWNSYFPLHYAVPCSILEWIKSTGYFITDQKYC